MKCSVFVGSLEVKLTCTGLHTNFLLSTPTNMKYATNATESFIASLQPDLSAGGSASGESLDLLEFQIWGGVPVEPMLPPWTTKCPE